MFHHQNTALHFLQNTEKMLKSLNNNTSPFSMENLLSREKLSPENLELNLDKSDCGDSKYSHETKLSLSPTENVQENSDNERLSPPPNNNTTSNDKNDNVFFKFNNCFKNRVCSNCGRLDCNFIQCRIQSDNCVVKDNKPVLKFSVSAILGNEHHQQNRNVQNGKESVTKNLRTKTCKKRKRTSFFLI